MVHVQMHHRQEGLENQRDGRGGRDRQESRLKKGHGKPSRQQGADANEGGHSHGGKCEYEQQ
jgi:hypothetical protein